MRVAVRPLVGTPVTPNQLTAVRLLAGLGGAGAFAVGDDPWVYAGVALFVLAMLLDRADGELARLSGKTSKVGHAFDITSDAVCNAVVFVGIAIGLGDGVLGGWAIPMGIVAGGAVALIFAMVTRIEAAAGARAAELESFGGFDVDDAILIVPAAVALGGAVPLLIAAAIGAPAFAVFFTWHFRRQLGISRE